MKWNLSLLVLPALAITVVCAHAVNPQRIGHTTLLPYHPGEKGLYAAVIDPAHGYAYFAGTFLSKVDITTDLPQLVGVAIDTTNHFLQGALDSSAGYAYFGLGTLNRYSLGVGTNQVSFAGAISLTGSTAQEILIDDSDPDPANHYGYVVCEVSGGLSRVAKIKLATMTEVSTVNLNPGETNFLFSACADAQKGYGYFVNAPSVTSGVASLLVKIKFTPGTNPPIRIGAISLGIDPGPAGGGCIDTVNGYGYYCYGTTNKPAHIYKVRLGAGDVPPAFVGSVDLPEGEGRLAGSVCDPQNGFVYFGDDNTYPGRLYQFALNGTNLPVEIGYSEMQGTTNAHPDNGITVQNFTTNADGVLPYGEVFFRSAVIDPVRGFVYLGQDSHPNQVVKVSLAKVDPFTLVGPATLADGSFQFAFSNIAGGAFSALATTNLAQPLSNWTALGGLTEVSPGQFQFFDSPATNGQQRFYRVRSP